MITTMTVRLPLTLRRQGSRKTIVTPAGTLPMPARVDITLVKALARAFRWRRMLETGRYATIDELARAEKINPSYVSRVLRLTLLAPDIVEAILDGRQPEGMTLPDLKKIVPVEWQSQRSNLVDIDSGNTETHWRHGPGNSRELMTQQGGMATRRHHE
jgi:hypothetical protein